MPTARGAAVSPGRTSGRSPRSSPRPAPLRARRTPPSPVRPLRGRISRSGRTGVMTAKTLLGEVPTFLNVCRVPLGACTHVPTPAGMVPSPSKNSTSPSSTQNASSSLACRCGGGGRPRAGWSPRSSSRPRRCPRRRASPRSGPPPAKPTRLRPGRCGSCCSDLATFGFLLARRTSLDRRMVAHGEASRTCQRGLFTRVRGRSLLGSSDAASCISAPADRENGAFSHAYRANLLSLATLMDRYAESWLCAGRTMRAKKAERALGQSYQGKVSEVKVFLCTNFLRLSSVHKKTHRSETMGCIPPVQTAPDTNRNKAAPIGPGLRGLCASLTAYGVLPGVGPVPQEP